MWIPDEEWFETCYVSDCHAHAHDQNTGKKTESRAFGLAKSNNVWDS